MPRRRYSDEEKAAALAALDANGGNVALTSQQLDIPDSTLRSWSNGRGTNHAIADLRDEKRRELTEELRDIAYALVGALPSKIHDASLRDTGVTLGVVLDKLQLLEGHATTRSELTGKNGGPIRIQELSKLSDDELDALIGD